jgi:hypothetical protein
MKQITIFMTALFFTLSWSHLSHAVTDSGYTPICEGAFETGSVCRTTPERYEVVIYEMGVCTANPMSGSSFNRDVCSTTFTNTAGFTYDFASVIGGKTELEGVSTRPANGTYKFPYMVMGTTFGLRASFFDGTNTYYSEADQDLNTSGPSVNFSESLKNFGEDDPGDAGNTCDPEYLNAPVDVGTISAYITNTTLVKPGASDKETVSTGRGNKVLCTNADRLVGLITLTNPFTISADTINMQFNFNITNYGVQFFNEDADTVPNDVGSGPFSGSFVIINK